MISSDMEMIIEISKSVINKLGIRNYKLHQRPEKCRILFSITNLGQSTDESWSTFPVLIDIEQLFVKIYIVFTFQGKTFSFTDQRLRNTLIDYLTLVNSHLSIGLLKFSNSKQYARFENCFCSVFLEKRYWESTFHSYIANALSSYKAFGFGFVRIVDVTRSAETRDLGYLLEICSSRFTGGDPLLNKQLAANLRRYKNSIIETEKGCTEIDAEFINKLQSSGLIQNFDVENLERKADGVILYHYDILEAMTLAPERGYQFPRSLHKQIIDQLLLLHQENISFQRFPFPLIKIKVSESVISSFTFGFNGIEDMLVKNPVPLGEYKLAMWKELTKFNLLIYSTKAYPDCHLTPTHRISESCFADKNIDSKKLLIGTGGFGTVYSNTYCGVTVAIKFPSQRKEDCITANERIKREYLLTRSVSHPYILLTYGYIQYNEKLGYVMHYCNKGTLNEAIKENNFANRIEKTTFIIKVATALNYLHFRSIVHLDLKPHNIFMDKDIPKIGDFGLSASLLTEKNTGMKLGCTVYYSPPEQIKSSPPKESSDMWAFGMTMYQFLLGQHPFSFLKDTRKIEKEAFYTLIKDQNLRPRITEEFEQNNSSEAKIMRKCWKLNPLKRPSAEEVYRKLLQLKRKLDLGLEI